MRAADFSPSKVSNPAETVEITHRVQAVDKMTTKSSNSANVTRNLRVESTGGCRPFNCIQTKPLMFLNHSSTVMIRGVMMTDSSLSLLTLTKMYFWWSSKPAL